ncbi:hypothetical protein [Deinococcus hopiensis]|uniref:Helix-turn-helix n=1 Tax=Deinococcus hopiensis KR-140 TaxID=695939 RepID=A0A1W1V7D2_9DEIO|nr:hypothetical protein [Deinococcus hopiensis]SMB89110.1 hypothetical protein SAMN00790413_00275 [Deinococcus hopiensis KR-140]
MASVTQSETEVAQKHGAFIDERRADKGLKWPEVARQMELHYGVKVTADYLSKIKRGHNPLAKATLPVREALRKVLGISLEEWHTETGLYTGTPVEPTAPTTPLRPLTDAERRGWVLPEEEPEIEIPDALREAAEMYGHGKNAPLAEKRWLLELADLDFREEPETPEDWLALYVRLSKLIDPK